MEYIIICSDDIADLTLRVNEHLKEGFMVHGGLNVTPTEGTLTWNYHQALLRKEKPNTEKVELYPFIDRTK